MGPIVKRIAAFWRPHRWLGAGLLVSMLLKTGFTVVLALSLKLIVDGVVDPEADSRVGLVLALLVGGFLLSVLSGLTGAVLAARAGAAILADVRTALFDRVQSMDLAELEKRRSGDLLARFSSDVAQLSAGVVKQPLLGLTSLVAVAFYVPVMFVLEARLAALAVVLTPLALAAVNRWAPDAQQSLDQEKHRIGMVLSEVTESLRAQPVIRLFGMGRDARRRFGELITRLHDASTTAEFRVQLLATLSEYAIAAVQVAVVATGAALALGGALEVGALVAFVSLLVEFAWEATVIGKDVVPEIKKSMSGIRRIDELLAYAPDPRRDRGYAAPDLAGDIRFEDVSFSYHEDGGLQLDSVTFTIPAGRYTAVVGSSGSGKSTLLALLMGFNQPTAGRLFLGSVDSRNVDPDRLREQLGVVLQDTFVFTDTLQGNVTLARPDASRQQLQDALDASGLQALIEELNDGVETLIGEGGRRLSGGQTQRIGLARALLRDPAVLLLDEATASLDPATEADIVAHLDEIRGSRTVVSVTHRLQTVTTADQIVVLDKGRVVETGSFDDLVAAGGVFAGLWQKQTGFVISGDGHRAAIEAERLRSIPLFADLADQDLDYLTSEFTSLHVDEGTVLFREGDPGDRFYVIVRGVVEVMDSESVIAHLEDGDFFGEMALLDGACRNATVEAVTPATLLGLGVESFRRLIEASPEANRAIRSVAAARAEKNLYR